MTSVPTTSRSSNHMPPPTPSTSPSMFHHQAGIIDVMLCSYQRSNRLELEEILHRYPESRSGIWHIQQGSGRREIRFHTSIDDGPKQEIELNVGVVDRGLETTPR